MSPELVLGLKIVFVTAPRKEAEKIGLKVVEKKLAACVNIVDKIKSIYWWKGKLNTDKESLLIFKTASQKIDEMISYIKSIHSYEVPEIIVLDIEKGNEDYLKWIISSVNS